MGRADPRLRPCGGGRRARGAARDPQSLLHYRCGRRVWNAIWRISPRPASHLQTRTPRFALADGSSPAACSPWTGPCGTSGISACRWRRRRGAARPFRPTIWEGSKTAAGSRPAPSPTSSCLIDRGAFRRCSSKVRAIPAAAGCRPLRHAVSELRQVLSQGVPGAKVIEPGAADDVPAARSAMARATA